MDKGPQQGRSGKSAKGYINKGRNGDESAQIGQSVEGQGPPFATRVVGPAECADPRAGEAHKKGEA